GLRPEDRRRSSRHGVARSARGRGLPGPRLRRAERSAVMTQALPKLPTSVVGSHGLPGWVWLAREALEAGRLGAIDLRELMEDATQAALPDMERARGDVDATGQVMRGRLVNGI